MGDGTEQAIDRADYSIYHACNIVESCDEQWVEIEGVEDALDNRDEVSEANYELEFRIHIGDCEVDGLDGDCNSRVDCDEPSNLGIEVDICLEIFHD